jgi:prepilin signal peptidase PulO-like enzyme (type II secretory pathway)
VRERIMGICLDRLDAPTLEDLVGIMTVMMVMLALLMVVMMATALALLMVIIVVMVMMVVLALFMVMMVTTALTLFIIVIIFIIVLIMVMMMCLFFIFFIMMVTATLILVLIMATLTVVMVVMMVMVMCLGGGLHFLHQLVHQRSILLEHSQKARALQLVDGSGDDVGTGIERANQICRLLHDLFACDVALADDHGIGLLDLVDVKLTEVAHLLFALLCIDNGGNDVERQRVAETGDRTDDVAELADAGRLDNDAIGMETIDNFRKGTIEIAH